LGLIVGYDGVGHSKVVDDVGEECYGLLRPEIRNGVYFDPLGELVDGDE
jgi:hypothetical protein